MFKADNVLRPEVVQEMFKMTKKMREVTFADKTWQDICLRVSVVATPTCFDYKQSNSKECKDFKMPHLSANDIALLIPLIKRVKEDGFSPKIGFTKSVEDWYLNFTFF